MTYKLTVTTLALTAITSTVAATHTKPDTEHPHIVLILCDDMGFSDLSCYGGEIHTPNIDYLAEQGIRFSQFKNTGRSCPSRAALLTGHYQHEAGMGWMTAVDEHRPGYRGQLSDHLPTLAEVLRDQGYATYMSGKWHVTLDAAFETPNGSFQFNGDSTNTTAACMEGEAITNQIPFIIICNGLPSFRMIITMPPLSQTLQLVLANNLPRRLPCSCT